MIKFIKRSIKQIRCKHTNSRGISLIAKSDGRYCGLVVVCDECGKTNSLII